MMGIGTSDRNSEFRNVFFGIERIDIAYQNLYNFLFSEFVPRLNMNIKLAKVFHLVIEDEDLYSLDLFETNARNYRKSRKKECNRAKRHPGDRETGRTSFRR